MRKTINLNAALVDSAVYEPKSNTVVVKTKLGLRYKLDRSVAAAIAAANQLPYYEEDVYNVLGENYKVDDIPKPLFREVLQAYTHNRENHGAGSGAMDMWDWRTSAEDAIDQFDEELTPYRK